MPRRFPSGATSFDSVSLWYVHFRPPDYLLDSHSASKVSYGGNIKSPHLQHRGGRPARSFPWRCGGQDSTNRQLRLTYVLSTPRWCLGSTRSRRRSSINELNPLSVYPQRAQVHIIVLSRRDATQGTQILSLTYAD